MTMTVTLHSGVHFLVINTYSIYNFSTLHVLIILSTHPCLKAKWETSIRVNLFTW